MMEVVGLAIILTSLGLIWWFLVAFLIGFVAIGRGRSAVGWTILALITSPIVAFALLAILPMRYNVNTYNSNGRLKRVWWTERKIKEEQYLRELDRRNETDTEGSNAR